MKVSAKTVVKIMSLVFLPFLGSFLAADMYLPAVPHIATVLHTSIKNIQITVGLYYLGTVISTLIFGPLSDRVGRRPIILLGSSIMIIGTLLCIFSQTYAMFMCGRIVQGFGAGTALSLGRSVGRDLAQGQSLARIFSIFVIAVGIAPAIAPFIGGYIQQHLGWRMIFITLAIYQIVLLIIFFFYFPETLTKSQQDVNRGKSVLKDFFVLLQNRSFLAVSICSALIYAGFMAYITASPVLLEIKLQYSPVVFGHISFLILLLGQIGKFCNLYYLGKIGYQRMIIIGLGLYLIAGVSMLLLGYLGFFNVYSFAIPIIISIIAQSLLFVNLATDGMTLFGNIAGAASALYGALLFSGGFVGSVVISHLPHDNQIPLGLLLTLIALLAILSYIIGHRRPTR